jgi:hypothetical protein
MRDGFVKGSALGVATGKRQINECKKKKKCSSGQTPTFGDDIVGIPDDRKRVCPARMGSIPRRRTSPYASCPQLPRCP